VGVLGIEAKEGAHDVSSGESGRQSKVWGGEWESSGEKGKGGGGWK